MKMGVFSCIRIFFKIPKLALTFLFENTLLWSLEIFKNGAPQHLWIGGSKMHFSTYGIDIFKMHFLTYGLVDPKYIF